MKIASSVLLVAATCLMLGVFTYFNSDEKIEPIANATSSLNEDMKKENFNEKIKAKEAQKLSEFKVLDSKLRKAVEIIKKENGQQGITPIKIRIPAINVKTTVEKVGILENGQMGVPSNIDNTGWFAPGTKPGATGNSVIDGHVDSKTGPAVFFDLKDLKAGDEIFLSDQQGKTLTFVVKKLKSYPNDNAPLKQIFGPANQPNLNLITCTGIFNHDKGTHEERLVVYSELKPKEIDQKKPKQGKLPKSPSNITVEGTFISWHAVQDDEIVGYRVYKGKKNGSFKHVASVSSYERKTFNDKDAGTYRYYVTSVNKAGQESKPSEIARLKK